MSLVQRKLSTRLPHGPDVIVCTVSGGLQQVARAYPDTELHLVMDNYGTHVCPESEVMEM